MKEEFYNLPQEKQERMINAAIEEFAEKGFKAASTNVITQRAGISKGLLFHYFGNKRGLYLSLFDYCMEFGLDYFYRLYDLSEKDFFKRLKNTQVIKIEMLKKFTSIFDFCQGAYSEDAPEVKQELKKRIENLKADSYAKIFDGVDMSPFRENTDFAKVTGTVVWTLEGYLNSAIQTAKATGHPFDYDKAFRDADEYIEFFKDAFYK